MDALAHWFATGGGFTVALVTVLVSVLTMAAVPRELKARLRGAIWLAVLGLFAEFPQRVGVWAPAWRMLQAVGWALVGCAAARVIVVITADVIVSRMQKHPMNQLRRDVLQVALYAVATVVATRAADVPVAGMVVTGTVVTAIVGLALQETLGNLAAGVALQFDRTLEPGDWVRVDKVEALGRVVSMSWRSVVLLTDDRNEMVIPNGVFTKTPFTNHSRPGELTRRSIYVTVSGEVPPVHVQNALLEACKDCDEVLKEPCPTVLTTEFNEQGVTYWLRFFIKDFSRRDPVQSEVTTKVWYELNRRKISLGVPRRETFVHKIDERYDARVLAEKIRDRRAAVEAVDFLCELSAESRDVLAAQGRRLLFAPGEIILEEGQSGRTFYIIRRGAVSVSEDGHEFATLGPGDFFGEMALLTGTARTATIRSTVETEVFEIDDALFSQVLKAEPRVAERIGEIVGQRQAQVEARKLGGPRPSMADVRGHSNEIFQGIKKLFGLD